MSIIKRTASPELVDALNEGIRRLWPDKPRDSESRSREAKHLTAAERRRLASRHSGDEGVAAEPLPVYTLTLAEIMRDGYLERAVQSGWQVMYGSSKGGVSAELHIESASTQPRVIAAARGARVRRVTDVIGKLEELDKEHKYELRLLSIPAALLEVFWLKAQSERVQDIFVPFATVSRELKKNTEYREAEFKPILESIAARFRAPVQEGAARATGAGNI